jgi:hypothetical protein
MHLGRGARAGLCAGEEIDGFLGVAPPDPGGSEQIVDVRAIGLDPANRFGLLRSLARFSEREERLPEQEADLDGLPVPFSRPTQLPGRVEVPTLGVIRAAERVESRSEGRVQLEGILQLDDCLVILAFLQMARAPIEVPLLLNGWVLGTREKDQGGEHPEGSKCDPGPPGSARRRGLHPEVTHVVKAYTPAASSGSPSTHSVEEFYSFLMGPSYPPYKML